MVLVKISLPSMDMDLEMNQEYMVIMAAMFISNLTHSGDHVLDLVFNSALWRHDLE